MMSIKKIIILFTAVIIATAAYFTLIKPYISASRPSQKNEAAQEPALKADPNNGMVSLNFDDGWKSDYQKALPILDQAGMKATFYIITQLHDDLHMTNDQILDLYARGNEIGAHTMTHPMLTSISPKVQKKEIVGSRNDLLVLGIKSVDSFAYPYGKFNAGLKKMVGEAGFAEGRGTNPGTNDSSTDRYALKSLDVKSDTDFPFIQAAIDGTVKNKQWLILTFHRIDETGDPVSASQSASSDLLRQVVNYLKNNNIAVVTTIEGIQLLH